MAEEDEDEEADACRGDWSLCCRFDSRPDEASVACHVGVSVSERAFESRLQRAF